MVIFFRMTMISRKLDSSQLGQQEIVINNDDYD